MENKYQEALNKIVEVNCPEHTSCNNCNIKSICNSTMKWYIDKLQELIDNQTQETTMYEYRDDCGDYPSISCKCTNCMTEVDEEDKYCSGCGYKFIDKIIIPDTECRLCRYSGTGFKDDCWYWRVGDRVKGSCKLHDLPHWIEHEQAEEENSRLVSRYECSNCHDWLDREFTYCPSCGKKMRFN